MTGQPLFAALKLEMGDTVYYLLLFSALLIAIKYFAWGPVSQMMDKRRQKISDDLDHAADDRKKASILANERDTALKNSKQEAVQIVSQAKTSAETTKQTILSDADSEAAEIKKRAQVAAVQAKQAALSAARAEVADISVTIAGKVIAKNLSAEDQKDLVDQFIKGLNN